MLDLLLIILSTLTLIYGFIRTSSVYYFILIMFVFLVTVHFWYLHTTGFYRFIQPEDSHVSFVLIANLLICILIAKQASTSAKSQMYLYFIKLRRVKPTYFWLFFLIYICLYLYIILTVSTMGDRGFDIYERNSSPAYEYIGLFLLMSILSRPNVSVNLLGFKRVNFYSFILFSSGFFIALFLLKSGMRLAPLQVILSLILFVPFNKVNKIAVFSIAFAFFIALNVIGAIRLGMNITPEILFSMVDRDGVLDNTFMGVIESGYMLNVYEFTQAEFPLLNGLVYTHWPTIAGFRPDTISYAGVNEGYTRFPGGGYISFFIINSGGFLVLSFFFLLKVVNRVERCNESAREYDYVFYWLILITTPRFILYNPSITFKYIFTIVIMFLFYDFLLKLSKGR